MTRINTNVGSTRGLRNLNRATSGLDQALERLSTGSKINRGRDNPSGLIAGEKLRLQVTTIEQSIKNSNRASNVIATADGALGEISGLLNQIRGLVQEGLNSGALSDTEIEANQLQIDTALNAINRISGNTTFAGDKLIDGSKEFVTSISSADTSKISDFRINEALLGTNASVDVSARVTSVAEKASLRYDGGALTSRATVEISGAKGNEVIFLGDNASLSDIQSAVNGVTDATGVTARTLAGASFADAEASTLNFGGTGNDGVTFTRAEEGTDATLGGSVSVVFTDPGANSSALAVAVTNDGSGNYTINVSLETDGGGAIVSTAGDIETLLNGDAQASALVSTVAEGDGSGVVAAAAVDALAGGKDTGTLEFTDLRASGATGNISVVIADPGANSQPLSIASAASGDDTIITISLATDGTGAITSTLDDIEAAFADAGESLTLADGETTLAEALSLNLDGDGTNIASAHASTQLSTTNGTVLSFESSDFGSKKFVDVNVLSGTFDTALLDGTAARRDTGADVGVTINGQNASTDGLEARIRSQGLDVSITLAESANVEDETATISIAGGGSLFQIGEQVSSSGQVGLGIEAVNTARLGGVRGKLYELGTGGGKSLSDVGVGAAGSDLVAIVDDALERVSTLRGRLGAIQKNVIETNISTLGVALENISEARSQIVDTDFAEETAALTRGQILSQAGISVLSIANQQPQQVLSLLG